MLRIPDFLSFLQSLWWSVRIIHAREILPATPHRESFKKQGALMPYRHAGVSVCPLPKCVKVQLFRDTSSTRGPSLSLYFSSYSAKSQWWPSVVSAPIFSPFSPCPILLPLFFFFWKLSFLYLWIAEPSPQPHPWTPTPQQNYEGPVTQAGQLDFSLALDTENVLGVGTSLTKGQSPFSNINTDSLRKEVFISLYEPTW